MDRRHDPAMSGAAPGLLVAPYSAVAPYPAAAVLTAWANATHVAQLTTDESPTAFSFDEPVLPATAEVAFWPQARLALGDALASIPPSWWPASCVLPVPGDLGGLPANAPRALSAGQAVVWSSADDSVMLSPMMMPGGDRMWLAERAQAARVTPPGMQETTRAIMAAMERCVALAEASLLPRQVLVSADVSRVAEKPVPLPPGTQGAVVALARQSATVVAIVAAAMTRLPETVEASELREALVPLGRTARQGLSVAFSHTSER